MSRMVVASEGWPWQPDKCPADKNLIELAEKEYWQGKDILHLGTGLHHMVGKSITDRNIVLGLTNSPEEMQAYIDLVIEDPKLSWAYSVLFGDIHVMNPSKLGKFDVITLFHLGEYPVEDYAPLDVADVIEGAISNLKPSGRLIGYTGSSAWDRVSSLFADICDTHRLYWKSTYSGLKIWQAHP